MKNSMYDPRIDHTYYVGDFVRINDTLDYRNTIAVPEMQRFCGQIMRIKHIDNDGFFICDKTDGWWWQIEHVTPIISVPLLLQTLPMPVILHFLVDKETDRDNKHTILEVKRNVSV